MAGEINRFEAMVHVAQHPRSTGGAKIARAEAMNILERAAEAQSRSKTGEELLQACQALSDAGVSSSKINQYMTALKLHGAGRRDATEPAPNDPPLVAPPRADASPTADDPPLVDIPRSP